MSAPASTVTTCRGTPSSTPVPDGVSGAPPVEVRRSRRRRRSVTAFREGGTIVVSIPARFTRAEEREWVALMTQRLADKERRRRPSDAALLARATELSATYLGGLARPASVRWASNQNSRWGSCTPADGSIRISDRVKGTPSWVLDYVLLHELAHLLEAGHGAAVLEAARGLPAHRAGARLPRGARRRPRPACQRGRRPRPVRRRGRGRRRRRARTRRRSPTPS